MAGCGRYVCMALIVMSLPLCALAQDPSALAVVSSVEKTLVDAIDKASPSVVAISQIRKRTPGESLNFEIRPGPLGPILPHQLPRPEDPEFIPTEYATGVVLDRRGLILTAYHVLQPESEFFVTTSQHKRYPAWIKAADPRSDLAVLAVEADDLVPIRLGDASKLRRGQFVVAMGNPYAVARDGQASASWGIVANLNRKAVPVPTEADSAGKTTLHHFGTLIQTDAKLNLGTSGGALLDLQGRMVGLTTSLAAVSGYETAAGYAYPVDETFRRVVDTLKRGREVEYGFLGIEPANLSVAEIRKGLQGIRVERIELGARAETFGLKIDDIVTAVNGAPIHCADDLVREVGQLPVEATARLDVLRGDRERTIEVKLSKYPVRGPKIVTEPKSRWRGVHVDYTTAIVDPEIRKTAGMKFFDDRVVVIDVENDSPGWNAGLRPGSLVTHVGRRAVRTPAEFADAVGGSRGDVRVRVAGPADRKAVDLVVPEA
jgi:serine protease Do